MLVALGTILLAVLVVYLITRIKNDLRLEYKRLKDTLNEIEKIIPKKGK